MTSQNLRKILSILLFVMPFVCISEGGSEAFKEDMKRVAVDMRDNLIEYLDKDENGNIILTKDDSKAGFEGMDTNNDNYVDRDEIIRFTEKTVTNVTGHATIIADKILGYDSDGDNRLDFDEFYKVSMRNKDKLNEVRKSKCNLNNNKKFAEEQVKKLEDLKKKPLFRDSFKDKKEEKEKVSEDISLKEEEEGDSSLDGKNKEGEEESISIAKKIDGSSEETSKKEDTSSSEKYKDSPSENEKTVIIDSAPKTEL